MSELQSPKINWQVKAGKSSVGFGEQKVLIIAQSDGTASNKDILEDVQENQIESLCGDKSLATLAFKRFRKYNKQTDIDIMALEENSSGDKAQGGINVDGTAGEAGTLVFCVGDDSFKVQASISKDDSATTVATAIKEAINATDYPFTLSLIHISEPTRPY